MQVVAGTVATQLHLQQRCEIAVHMRSAARACALTAPDPRRAHDEGAEAQARWPAACHEGRHAQCRWFETTRDVAAAACYCRCAYACGSTGPKRQEKVRHAPRFPARDPGRRSLGPASFRLVIGIGICETAINRITKIRRARAIDRIGVAGNKQYLPVAFRVQINDLLRCDQRSAGDAA